MLFSQPGLVVPNHQGDVTIMLQNCSDQDIKIPRDTTLGYLENLNNKEFNNISVIDQEKVKEDFSHDAPLPKPMSESVKVDFLAHANIKVPAQERQAYEELIAQNHDVFTQIKMTWDVLIILNTKSKQKLDWYLFAPFYYLHFILSFTVFWTDFQSLAF